MPKRNLTELAIEFAMLQRLVKHAVLTRADIARITAGATDLDVRSERLRELFEHRAEERFPGGKSTATYADVWARVYARPLALAPPAGVASAQT